jgi:hypothetical protein
MSIHPEVDSCSDHGSGACSQRPFREEQQAKVGRCRLTPGSTALGFSALKLKYDELLSNSAFNVNLRRYSKGTAQGCINEVGRCSLPVSQPELKARLVSALETKV